MGNYVRVVVEVVGVIDKFWVVEDVGKLDVGEVVAEGFEDWCSVLDGCEVCSLGL